MSDQRSLFDEYPPPTAREVANATDPALARQPVPRRTLVRKMPPLVNPISHTNDPETSAEAAATVIANGTRDRHAMIVLELVRRHPGSTAIKLMEAQTGDDRLDEYQIRRRLTDLKEANLVTQGQKRPCRVRGSQMVTWAEVRAGGQG